MYEKLASGYATQFIERRRDFAEIMTWLNSKRHDQAFDVFSTACLSKKPGRVVKKMKHAMHPPFSILDVARWTKAQKVFVARQMASAQEARMFDMSGAGRELFPERAVFLANSIFVFDEDGVTSYFLISGGISHHAIKRMLEREVSSPETLKDDVEEILMEAFGFRTALEHAERAQGTHLDDTQVFDIPVPFRGGALILRTLQAGVDLKGVATDRLPIFSARTFLPEAMLTDRLRARMEGYPSDRHSLPASDGVDATLDWMTRAAEPAGDRIAPEGREKA